MAILMHWNDHAKDGQTFLVHFLCCWYDHFAKKKGSNWPFR
jgi:hypothetical protein